MKKKLLSLLLVAAVLTGICSGCGSDNDKDASSGSTEAAPDTADIPDGAAEEESGGQAETSGEPLSIVTTPGIHQEILEKAAGILANKGIELNISLSEDYMAPNMMVDADMADANYFQHEAYLKDFNMEQDMDLVSVGRIHFEPLGLYKGTKESMSDLKEGDVIIVPEDASNKGRALLLLQNAGLIKLTEDGDGEWTLSDITENPHGLVIQPAEASFIPSMVKEAALLVINGNYAREAFYSVTHDSLVYENPQSEQTDPYWNVVAVKSGNESDERIQQLVETLQSDEIKDFINHTYDGSVVVE